MRKLSIATGQFTINLDGIYKALKHFNLVGRGDIYCKKEDQVWI